ncbi:aKG-HExxH-type peptide beta-hydroxylase [Streptomyces violarus]|uniref:aKG-HExxH-type peptide beta-hydroxylase n=1 Tax=Streptomyces violarus TaxID=67380 RepID=UPI0021C18E77|nr:HEXXH motif-containing putative peptide modification protein [Streptomyces violarus]MCT9141294.1 HEXXH motif-containing putative peptide modification protein [Streptomyces violarus]
MWFDRGLMPERVAKIIVTPANGGPSRRGSGYLVSAGRVLTAAHVVEDAATIEIRFQADRPDELSVAAAVEWRHAGIDVAVLVVPVRLGGTSTGALPAASYGRIGERDVVLRCTALGFPRFKLRTDTDGSRYRDAEHADTTCAALSNRGEGTLDLKVTSPPADDPDPGKDAWEGMSGAAVFCEGHLVGVVSRHHRSDGPGRIAAGRVDRWAEALTRTELVALEHVLGRALAPQELPDVTEAAVLGMTPADRIGGPLGRSPSPPASGPAAVPLAVPQRRIAPDRLRGRDETVSELTAAITRRANGDASEQGVWLLSGMGGCGKTTLALEAAHRLAATMTQVWWVSAADAEVLSLTLRAVAFDAGARVADFSGPPHPADVLWRFLNALTTPWLLVLDNVDDPSMLAAEPARTAEGVGWLRPPALPWGTVLLTSRESRREKWGDWVHMVGVGILSGSDGAEVLHDLAPGAGSAEEAGGLAEHLGGLPLALNLAGSYLARALEDPWPLSSTPQTFDEYRASLDARLSDMAFDPDTGLGPDERNRRAILSTWELSLDLLHRQGTDLARPLLRLLSALGPAPVPYQELVAPQLLAESKLFSAPTENRLKEAVKGLAGLQLITIETTRESTAQAKNRPQRWITIHPMVRAACRAHADFSTQTPRLLRLVTGLLQSYTRPLDTFDPKDWPRWQAIAPHCAAVLTLLPEDDRVDPDLAVAATEPAVRAAQYRSGLGMYGEAISDLDTLGSIRSRLLGDDHPATIAAALHRAWAVRHTGALTEADRQYQEVAGACARAELDGHAYLQSAKTGRARVLRELGRYEEAEEESRAALAMRLQAGTHPRGILRIRHDLAILAHKRGRHEEAVTELRSVLREIKELAGEHDLDTLATWVTLARALREAGHAGEAEEAIENAVRGYLEVLGPGHPDVLMARHERARLIRDHESDPECLERAKDECADIWQFNERHLGPDHPDTIAARHELATTWHLLGRPDLAAQHYEAVLEAGRGRLGDRHPDVLRCERNLARVKAELAGQEPASGGGADGDGNDASLRGGSPMDDERPADEDAPADTGPDLTDLSLEQALTGSSHSAAARLVGRYVRPRTSRGGDEAGGGGYSESSYGRSADRPVSYTPVPAGRDLRRDLEQDMSRTPFPTSADLRTMAAGAEDGALAQRLRAQQRGARAVVLDELLDLADVITFSRETEGPRVRDVRDLLVRGERADPEAVTNVLLHPSVGRWLTRALRALHTPPGGPHTWTGTPPADLLRLHSVAAAAGVRAQLLFVLPVPVHDGYVHLPGLGAADLRASGTVVAHVVSMGSAAVVNGEGVEVRLPSRSDPNPPGWISVHRVRTPVGRRHLDLVLEDADPYRESAVPLPPEPLGPVALTRWRKTIRDAGELLSDLRPGQADAVAVALTALTPRPEAEPTAGMMTSVSSSEAFGGAVLSTPPDAVELAVTLLHEFRHMELNAVLDSRDLYDTESDGPDEEFYYAPWRDDPRPLPGFLHGVFAFFAVVDFWRELTHRARDQRLRRRAQFQYGYWRTQVRHAYDALCSTPHLTTSGRELLAEMEVGTARWTDLAAVPEEVTALATEAVVAHRTRWRLHHLSPDPHTVSELAEAWRSGADHAPRTTAPVLLPDSAVPSLNRHTAQLCRWATAPGEDTVDDPADLARLRGDTDEARRLAFAQVTQRPQRHDPWVRLGLTLRREVLTSPANTAGEAAAQALTHRPEVVRDTFARITAETGTQPDPVALATWLGTPDELPDLPSMHPL